MGGVRSSPIRWDEGEFDEMRRGVRRDVDGGWGMTTISIDGLPGRLIDESLFVGAGDSRALRGSRCGDCSTVSFPAQRSCPKCTGGRVSDEALPLEGTLWAYTIQGFPPKPPYLNAEERPFRPYAVGYVDLGNEILVETRIVASDVDALAVGDVLRLVLEPIHAGADGTIYTYAFTPATDVNGEEQS